LRNRDSMLQERVNIDQLKNILEQRVSMTQLLQNLDV